MRARAGCAHARACVCDAHVRACVHVCVRGPALAGRCGIPRVGGSSAADAEESPTCWMPHRPASAWVCSKPHSCEMHWAAAGARPTQLPHAVRRTRMYTHVCAHTPRAQACCAPRCWASTPRRPTSRAASPACAPTQSSAAPARAPTRSCPRAWATWWRTSRSGGCFIKLLRQFMSSVRRLLSLCRPLFGYVRARPSSHKQCCAALAPQPHRSPSFCPLAPFPLPPLPAALGSSTCTAGTACPRTGRGLCRMRQRCVGLGYGCGWPRIDWSTRHAHTLPS